MFKSITVKLFVLTSLAVVVFVGLMLLFQSIFFESYYLNRKIALVEASTRDLAAAYSRSTAMIDNDLVETVTKYTQQYGLEVYYIEEYPDNTAAASGAGSATTRTSMVTAISEGTPRYDSQFYIEQMKYGREIYLKDKAGMDAGKSLTYSAQNEYGNASVITLSSIVKDGKPRGLLYIFASLRPVDEATSVIRDYYLLYFLGAFVVILVLAFVFSRQVARPLLHLDRVAASIANLDFSQECTLKSNDELGNLARTINRLSANLSKTIADLKESNEKLAQEIARQKELEEMRTLFVAGVSHELKTPISVIRGYTEGVIDGMAKGEIKQEYIQIIQDETEKMNQIISDMLDLAQMETGRYQLKVEEISINRMIRYEVKKFSPWIASKKIVLTVDLPETPLLAEGDSLRIEQVLANLLNNACRYTPEGGRVHLAAYDSGGRIHVQMENDCAEISAAELARIWDDFYRVEKSRNRELGGSGLGLAVVRHILELHRSVYGVEQMPGGVRFYFSLKKCCGPD